MRCFIEAVKKDGKVRFSIMHTEGNSKIHFETVETMFPRCDVKIYQLVDVTDNYRG